MAKNAKENEASSPGTEPGQDTPAVSATAAMRELVEGGAAYEQRRRNEGEATPVTASKIVAQFSPEKRTPSRSGLPKWPAAGGNTAPGGKLAPSPSDATGDAASELASSVPHAQAGDMASIVPTEPGIVIPTDRAKWAEEVAQEVRAKGPNAPKVTPAPLAAPAPGPASKQAKDGRAQRAELATVAKSGPAQSTNELGEPTPDAPPVVSGRRTKQTELRIGIGAVALAALILGLLAGRWVWFPWSQTQGRAVTSPSLAPSSTLVPRPEATPSVIQPALTNTAPTGAASMQPPAPKASQGVSSKGPHMGASVPVPVPVAPTPPASAPNGAAGVHPSPTSPVVPAATSPAAPIPTDLKPF